jgi:hypothetical protein
LALPTSDDCFLVLDYSIEYDICNCTKNVWISFFETNTEFKVMLLQVSAWEFPILLAPHAFCHDRKRLDLKPWRCSKIGTWLRVNTLVTFCENPTIGGDLWMKTGFPCDVLGTWSPRMVPWEIFGVNKHMFFRDI